jgi:membrane-associated two-gene conflict system component 1 (EACC1)
LNKAHIDVICSDLNELITLERWLRQETELRGAVRLSQSDIRSGEMGGVFDAVEVAVASGGAASLLVTSLFTWLGQRTKAATLRLKLRRPDGAEIELDLDGVQDADVIAGKVISFMTQQP